MEGAQTQEEALCRSIPGLYPSLCASNSYPYNSYETFLWSPKMWFKLPQYTKCAKWNHIAIKQKTHVLVEHTASITFQVKRKLFLMYHS